MHGDSDSLLKRLSEMRVLAGQHRITLSSNGRYVAYTIRRVHGESEPKGGFYPTGAPGLARGCEVRVTDVATSETKVPLPERIGRSWRPSWSTDSGSLAFYADTGGTVHLHVWNRHGSETREYAAATVRCRGYAGDRPHWSPNGRRIYLPVCPEGLEHVFTGEEPPPVDGPVVLYSGRTSPRATPPPDLRTLWGADIGCIDLAAGTLRRLTSGLPVAEPHLSPDGRWIAFYTLSRQDLDVERCELYVLSASGGDPFPVAVGLVGSSQRRHRPAWHPQSVALAFIRDGRPFVHGIGGGSPQPLAQIPEAVDERYLAWAGDGDGILVRGHSGALWLVRSGTAKPARLNLPDGYRFSRPLQPEASDTVASQRGAILIPAVDERSQRTVLFRVPLNGTAPDILWEDEATCEFQSFSNTWHWFADASPDGGTLVYARETATSPANLWGRSMAVARPLTDLNPGLQTETRVQVINFRRPEGCDARGLLWLPRAGVPPFPLVTVLAPDLAPAASPLRFEPEAAAGFAPQYLVARGLAVWMPNLRWPTGERGLGEHLAWDALASVDALVSNGLADGRRLALAGYGLGAYAVHSLLVRTDRFRAAVSTGGIGNFTAVHGTLRVWHGHPDVSAASQCEGLLGVDGGPWADPWRYVRESPLFALDQVRTPVLFIAGGDGAPETEAMFAALYRLGRDAVFLRYPSETGEIPLHWRPEAFRDVVRRTADWICEVLNLIGA